MAEQFAELGRFFVRSGGETGYRLLVNTLLPLLSQLVSDSQAAVRHAAGDGLVAVAELLRVEDRGQHILTTVLQLSHDDEQEDLRMAAVVLLNQLARYLGPDASAAEARRMMQKRQTGLMRHVAQLVATADRNGLTLRGVPDGAVLHVIATRRSVRLETSAPAEATATAAT